MSFNLTQFANKILHDMAAAQAAGSAQENKMDADDRAAADQLQAERYERSCEAIYQALMLGLDTDHARHLAAECGIQWQHIESYRPVYLRRHGQGAFDWEEQAAHANG